MAMSLGFDADIPLSGPSLDRPGLALPSALDGAAELASRDLGLSRELVERDYYMHMALYTVVEELPRESTLLAWRAGKAVPVGGWAFGGGTALVSGHGLVQRYSEDIDLVVYGTGELGRTPRGRLCKDIREVAIGGITSGTAGLTVTLSGGTVKTAEVRSLDSGIAVRVDVGPIFDSPDTRVYGQVTCLIGRYVSATASETFPELRIKEVPLVPAEVTAANKLATLHGRAVHNDLAGLAERPRDVYDLASIARDEAVVARIGREVARRAATGEDMLPAVAPWWASPRPVGGYAASPVFDPTTEAYTALKAAFESTVVERLLWESSQRWSFEDAMATVMMLDGRRPTSGPRRGG